MSGNADDELAAHADGASASARLARNVASVAAVPWEELPDGPARGYLLEMAYLGGDVGALQTADGRWWVRLGSQMETCAAWRARFRV